MNKLQIKRQLLTIGVTLGLLISVNASAQEDGYESIIAAAVVTQGQQLMQDLSFQLQQSIVSNISNFSVAQAMNWSTEQQSKTMMTRKIMITKKISDNSNQTAAE